MQKENLFRSLYKMIQRQKRMNNTEVVFEISSANNKTQINFTHIGLVPGIECYDACEKGWDGHVTNSLLSFINEGKGNPK